MSITSGLAASHLCFLLYLNHIKLVEINESTSALHHKSVVLIMGCGYLLPLQCFIQADSVKY